MVNQLNVLMDNFWMEPILCVAVLLIRACERLKILAHFEHCSKFGNGSLRKFAARRMKRGGFMVNPSRTEEK